MYFAMESIISINSYDNIGNWRKLSPVLCSLFQYAYTRLLSYVVGNVLIRITEKGKDEMI